MEPSKGSAARVGFVIFVAMIIVIIGVYMVGDGGGFFRSHVTYYTFFPSAIGLQSGAPVSLNGVRAGKVQDIGFPKSLDRQDIMVTLEIEAKVADRIRENSFAWIGSRGLLGDKEVLIQAGDPSRSPLPPGSLITGTKRSEIVNLVGPELAGSASDLFDNIRDLLHEINAGKGTIGLFLKNPELYNNLNGFTKSLSTTSDELAAVTRDMEDAMKEVRGQKGTLGKLIFSEEYAAQFTHALQSANRLMDDLAAAVEPIAKGQGALGKVIRDDRFADDLTAAVGKLSSFAARLDAALKAMEENRSMVGLALRDPAVGKEFANVVTNLGRSADRLASILEKIDTGDGSAGMLVNDPSIAASLRNIFIGVQDKKMLMNLVRDAEENGKKIRDQELAKRLLRDEPGRAIRREVLPVPGPEGTPLPAVGKQGEERVAPSGGTAPPPPAEKGDRK